MSNWNIELRRGKKFLVCLVALSAFAAPVLVGLTSPATAQAQAATTIMKIQMIEGKRVKLNYPDADVRELLKALAEAAQVNILVNDQVKGKATVNLAEMPWDQALTIILHSRGLVMREKDGIIFVEPAGAPKG